MACARFARVARRLPFDFSREEPPGAEQLDLFAFG
jgi:hypothetical protein